MSELTEAELQQCKQFAVAVLTKMDEANKITGNSKLVFK